MNRGQRQAVQKVGQDKVRRLTRRSLSMPLAPALGPRSIPTSTARSVRSSSPSIRGSAKVVRVLGFPSGADRDRPTRPQDWTPSQERPGSRPCALPPALPVDKLPAWVMNHSPRSTEPSPRCRILRDVGSSSTSTSTRPNGRRPRSPRRWACTEPVAHTHLERLVALGYLVSGQRRGTSGKPAKLYRLTGRQIELSYPVRRFARLAAELAQALRGFNLLMFVLAAMGSSPMEAPFLVAWITGDAVLSVAALFLTERS
jgi:hypothetical protein